MGLKTVAVRDGELPLPVLEEQLCTLAGRIAAATAEFLRLLAEFDERDGWAGPGILSCGHWLSWRCGLSLPTARDQLRVARRLRALPQTAACFAEGRLSYSKVRAICRVATPATEAELIDTARCATAAQVERLSRVLPQVAPEHVPNPPSPGPPPLRLTWRWEEDGTLRVNGQLSPEDGAAFLAALDNTARVLNQTAATGPPTADGKGDEEGDSAESIERLACDGGVRLATHGSDGRTLDLGRRRGRPTDRQLRCLTWRDGGCSVPGCDRTRYLHAHHVQYWSRGGSTILDNLVLLCGRHHRALHDGAFGIQALGRQRFRFHDAAGTRIDYAPTLPTGRHPLDSLAEAYRLVDGQTLTPNWHGEDLDVDIPIQTHVRRREAEAGVAVPAA